MNFAIGRVHDGIHRPSPDEPAIQAHLVGAIGSGAVREQKRLGAGAYFVSAVPHLFEPGPEHGFCSSSGA